MATLWVSSAGAQTYPQDYYTLRLYQTNYAVSWSIDPTTTTSTVIDGETAIAMIEAAKGTDPWQTNAGAEIYTLLEMNDAMAIFVDVPSGAPDYILVPFPSHFILDDAAIFELVVDSCSDVTARIGHLAGQGWCACLLGCPPNSCPACDADTSEFEDRMLNDSELFNGSDPTDVLPLWD